MEGKNNLQRNTIKSSQMSNLKGKKTCFKGLTSGELIQSSIGDNTHSSNTTKGLMCVQFNHGGKFENNFWLAYVGGEFTRRYCVSDSMLNYEGISEMLLELGHKDITKIHYRVPRMKLTEGLRLLTEYNGDMMLNECRKFGYVDIYTEHEMFEQAYVDPKAVNKLDVNALKELGGEPGDEEYEFQEVIVADECDSDGAFIVDDESDEEVIEVRQQKKHRKQLDVEKKQDMKEARAREGVEPTANDNDVASEIPRENFIAKEVLPSNENPDECEVEEHENNIKKAGYESDYRDSSDYDSPQSESDGESSVQRPAPNIVYPIYDPKDMFKIDPYPGLRFSKVHDLKNLCIAYAVRNGYNIKFPRSGTKELRARCVEGCPWTLWCTRMQREESFQIKTMKIKHRCRKKYHIKVANVRFFSGLYQSRIMSNPRWLLRDLAADVLDKYGVKISVVQAYRLKCICLGEVDNILKGHYGKLWDYAYELRRTNPGSTIKIKADGGVFKRMYICFEAVKSGWKKGCRPVIGIDGAFLKGYIKGELLTAVGRDGNNQMYPIAWAVVSDGENTNSWTWFLELLMDDLDYGDGNGLTIISDKQKGLINAISDVVPNVEHRNCARHVYANFRVPFGGARLKLLFWQACKNGTPQEHQNTLAEIEEHSSPAREWLRGKGMEHFCRAYFKTFSKCEAVENNMCEVWNGVLVEARAKPIISMLEDIRVYMMERILKRRNLFDTWAKDDIVGPRIRARIEKNQDDHRQWGCIDSGDNKFEVKHVRHKDQYVVDMNKRTCSCRMWELSGIPCCHAICAIYENREEVEDYVSDWYKLDIAKSAYENLLQPINGERLWERQPFEHLQPPPARRMPGRPKKARRKEQHEDVNKKTRVSKIGTQISCSRCKVVGHNKSSCKATQAEVDIIIQSQPQKRKQKGAQTEARQPKRKSPMMNSGGEQSEVIQNERVMNIPRAQNDSVEKNHEQSEFVPKKRVINPPRKQKNGKPPAGFGVYVAPNGSRYVKLSAQKSGKWIDKPTTKKHSNPGSSIIASSSSSPSQSKVLKPPETREKTNGVRQTRPPGWLKEFAK